VVGYWGFEPFTGPTLPLQDFQGLGWKLSTDRVLIAGRDNHLNLASTGTACIDKITLEKPDGRQVDVQWKQSEKASVVDIALPLKMVDPGAIHVNVSQYGGFPVAAVMAQTFSEPAKLTSLSLHAGDATATLAGTSLDQVKQLAFNDVVLTPSGDPVSHGEGSEQSLQLALAANAPAPTLKVGEQLTGRVSLRDGRTLNIPVTIAPSRPAVTLLNKNIAKSNGSPIHLANTDDLALDQQLTFSIRSQSAFPRDGKIEIASPDESLHTTLSVASGSLVLQNSHTVLATLDPLKSFGTSAFGPLRLRPVAADGTPGDWIPLATLVRLPSLDSLHCPGDPNALCALTGSSLYLVDAISTDQAFTTPIDVPEGFVGNTINLPRPPKTGFYLKLRDEPEAANLVSLPVQIQHGQPTPPPPAPAAAKTAAPVAPAAEPAPAQDPAPAASSTATPPQDRQAH
jgi:hypothetical protein